MQTAPRKSFFRARRPAAPHVWRLLLLALLCADSSPNVAADNESAGGTAGGLEAGGDAGPVTEEVIQTYPIRGRSVRELNRAMLENGPGGNRAGGAIARTSPQFQWSYTSDRRAGECAVQSFRIKVVARIIMPEWKDAEGAPQSLQAEWLRFREDVLQHEREHARLAYLAAAKIKAEALKVTVPDCASMKAALRSKAEAAVARLDAEQRDLDKVAGSCRLRGTCMR